MSQQLKQQLIIAKGALSLNHNMQQQAPCRITQLLTSFIETIVENQSFEKQVSSLTRIKQAIIHNPNNYYHQFYGRSPFLNLYEFIIECLSYQHHHQLFTFLVHVLALITKYWITSPENLKKLYEGILSLFQQKSHCGQNCFKYFTALVETMQQSMNFGQQLIVNQKYQHYSQMPSIRSTLQNYVIYHLLNQLFAFANIFLDRSVVRNEQIANQNNERSIRSIRESQQNSKFNMSQSVERSNNRNLSNSNSQDQSMQEPSEQCELYKIQQTQSVILSILSLIRACLSYDFSYTSRHQQESQYQPHKSPIIIPTKYSKYCKFSEFDIFLKNEHTTQMLNYLFLICNSIDLKLQILRILQAMARIHFRYFKNKTMHKVHLEDIGYVVANLLTGLDLEQSLSVNIKGNVRTTLMDTRTKVSIALSLGQIVSILLYHQPTFYLVQTSLLQMLLQHIQTFIMDQILDPIYFDLQNNQAVKLKKTDLCLLIQTFMSPFCKLKDFSKNYLSSNQLFNQKINQIFINVGQKYFKILNLYTYQIQIKQSNYLLSKLSANNKKTIKDQNDSLGKAKLNRNIHKVQIQYNSIPQQNSSKYGTNLEQEVLNYEKQEEQTIRVANKPDREQQIIKQLFERENSQKYAQTSNQSDTQQTQTNFKVNTNQQNDVLHQIKQKDESREESVDKTKKKYIRNIHNFIQSIYKQQGNIQTIRNLLSLFKIYCPKHSQLSQILSRNNMNTDNMNGLNLQAIANTNSEISYRSKDTSRVQQNNIDDNRSVEILESQQKQQSIQSKINGKQNNITNNILFKQKNGSIQISSRVSSKVHGYYKWMISWLCNFQNHFYVTAGHCRHSLQWEAEIHEQLILQLVADLHNAIQVFIKQLKLKSITNQQIQQDSDCRRTPEYGYYQIFENQREQAGEVQKVVPDHQKQIAQIGTCLKIIILYLVDKVCNECRHTTQQYVQNIKLDVILLCQWMINYVGFEVKNKNGTKKGQDAGQFYQLTPILDMINNLNLVKCLEHFVHSILKEQSNNKKYQQFQYQRITQDIIKNMFNRSSHICKQFLATMKEITIDSRSLKQDTTVYGRIIYTNLKLCMCIHNIGESTKIKQQHQSSYDSNQPQTEIYAKLCQIIGQQNKNLDQSQLLLTILTQILQNAQSSNIRNSYHVNSNSMINMQIYHQIKVHVILYNQHQCLNNMLNNQVISCSEKYLLFLKCLCSTMSIERKIYTQYHQSQIRNSENNTILQLPITILVNVVQYLSKSGASHKRSELIAISLQLSNQLVLIKNRHLKDNQTEKKIKSCIRDVLNSTTECLSARGYLLCTLDKLVEHFLSVISVFTISYQSSSRHKYSEDGNESWDSSKKIIVKACSCLLGMLQQASTTYAYNNPTLLKIQQNIINFIFNSCHREKGVVPVLQSWRQCYSNRIHGQGNRLVDQIDIDIQQIVRRTLRYIEQRCTQQMYSWEQQSNSRVIRVDNIILILSMYHNTLQYLFKNYKWIVDEVVNNRILKEAISLLGEVGPRWIIRKLQLWQLQCPSTKINQPINVSDEINKNECNPNIQSSNIQIRSQVKDGNMFNKIHENNYNSDLKDQIKNSVQQQDTNRQYIQYQKISNIELQIHSVQSKVMDRIQGGYQRPEEHRHLNQERMSHLHTNTTQQNSNNNKNKRLQKILNKYCNYNQSNPNINQSPYFQSEKIRDRLLQQHKSHKLEDNSQNTNEFPNGNRYIAETNNALDNPSHLLSREDGTPAISTIKKKAVQNQKRSPSNDNRMHLIDDFNDNNFGQISQKVCENQKFCQKIDRNNCFDPST